MHVTEFATPEQVADAKRQLRARIVAARRRRRPGELVEAADRLAAVLLAAPEVRRAAVVAAYVGVGTEPGTGPLLDGLAARGVRVLLPVLQRDGDLDWAVYQGQQALAGAPRGLLEPWGARLGRDAVGTADAVLVPGLACDRRGGRLGRGGGSYDRVLPRVATGTFTCVLLHEEELLEGPVPTDRTDALVGAAATPTALVRFGRGGLG